MLMNVHLEGMCVYQSPEEAFVPIHMAAICVAATVQDTLAMESSMTKS